VRIDVTEGVGKGESDERAVLERALEKGRCYVKDRGYAKFKLFNGIVKAESSYVCRLRDNSVYQVLEQRPLGSEDTEAGIVSDAIVQLGETSKADARPDHTIRLVAVKTTPHYKRGKTGVGSTGPASSGLMLIATNLLDLPAWIIALLYKYRWTIEVFFRFLKHMVGCKHLLSHDEAGIKIQAYCAMIAFILISLWTGRKPSLRSYEMICYYFLGLATEDELLAHLAKLKARDEARKK
jgi:IS4 transposase